MNPYPLRITLFIDLCERKGWGIDKIATTLKKPYRVAMPIHPFPHAKPDEQGDRAVRKGVFANLTVGGV